MIETLYPKNINKMDMSLAQREEINRILTFNVSLNHQDWIEFISSFFVLFLTIHWTKNVYQYSIYNVITKWRKRDTSISSNSMDFVIPPRLAVTVKSDTCTKTVWALIDTGAEKSFISAKLAKELNLEPQEANQKKFVDVLIGKPNGNDFNQIKLELTSVLISSKKYVNPLLHSQISNILNGIPLFNVPEEGRGKLLIGTDLIPTLLYQSPLLPNRCFSLASNLNLIETRLGYYFQGTQYNLDTNFCRN
ncbi:hypothetical protein TYRP_003361, partial [Tyrophagus putrescentiae]